jgi:hypothetical protein
VKPITKLPITKVLLGAFVVPWWSRRALAEALAIPVGGLVAVRMIYWHLGLDWTVTTTWMLWIVQALFWVLFAIACHRIVLLGPAEAAMGLMPRWTRREFRFAAWAFVTYAIATAGSWIATLVFATLILNIARSWVDPEFGLIVAKYAAGMVLTYLFARLAVMLPAAAIEARVGLGMAWRMTRGNGLRMLVIVGALPWILGRGLDWLARDEPTAPESAVLAIFSTLLVAVEIAALSLAYRELAMAEEPPKA